MENSTNKSKLKKLITENNSSWYKNASERFENKDWILKSSLIALKILRTIKARGISQLQLADSLNVSPQQVSKILKGQENLTLKTIDNIEKVLKIDLNSNSRIIVYEYESTPIHKLTKDALIRNTNRIAKECVVYDDQSIFSEQEINLQYLDQQ